MAVQSDYRYTLDAGEKYLFDVISFELIEELSEPFRLELIYRALTRIFRFRH